MEDKIKLAVVTGPTASGKTSLAVELALELNGEIIGADSMQIYQGLPIATAQPTLEEQKGVPHHLIAFLKPDQPFSVSDYVSLAQKTIQEVWERGKLPILCGGTGLYLHSTVDCIEFDQSAAGDDALREELMEQAKKDQGESLYRELCRVDPDSAKIIHPHNYVRLVRAIEVYRLTGKTLWEQKRLSRRECRYQLGMVGLNYADRSLLYDRIDRRVDQMVEQGLLEEAGQVLANPALKTAANAIGYKELRPWLEGSLSLEECLENLKRQTRRYAKRQITWLKRDSRIHWLDPSAMDFESLVKQAKQVLQKDLSLCYNSNIG